MESTADSSRRWTEALPRRPAVTAAAFFIGGIALYARLPHVPLTWALAAMVLAAVALAFRRRNRSCVPLAGAIFCCGVAAGQIEAFRFPANDVSAFAGDERRLARLELEFHNPLRIITTPSNTGRPLPPKQVTTAKVLRVLTRGGWIDTAGEVLVQIDPPNPTLAIGQRVQALGMLQRPAPAMNPGQFDWERYYRQQRILTSFHVPQSSGIVILRASPPSPLARARLGVRALLERGFTSAQSLDHALLRALVLGDRDPELSDVREQFRRTGTSHHLAISGMHVAILTLVIFGLCKVVLLRPRTAALVAMGFVAIYGLLALPSPPVVRSVLLCLAIGIGIVGRRSVDHVQLLALSVLAMLVYHPLDLFNAGFQLSFGTVLGLMVLTHRFLPLFDDTDARIALTSRDARPPVRLIVGYRIRTILAAPVAASVIAWAVSIPLICYHFEQLNPWAVLGSLLMMIPVAVALIGGLLKIVLTALVPAGAPVWAELAAIPVAVMRWGVDLLARLPGSDVPLPTRSILFIVLYYGLLLIPLVPALRSRLGTRARLGPACALLLFVMIPLTGGAAGRLADASLRVTVLAVGAGQCCVVELPDGRLILLDAGSSTMTDPVGRCIGPFLRSRGRSRIDELWLCDADFDHVGAAAEIIRGYGVRRVVTSAEFGPHLGDSATGEALLQTIEALGVKLDVLHRGDRITMGKGVEAQVLWPPIGIAMGSNDSDLVFKLRYARRTILFPADVQEAALAELIQTPAELACDVLLAPHHGSAEPATPAFLAAADPLYVVSSNDRTLSQKQKLFERQMGERPLFRTHACGAVTILIEPHGGVTVTPFHWRQVEALIERRP